MYLFPSKIRGYFLDSKKLTKYIELSLVLASILVFQAYKLGIIHLYYYMLAIALLINTFLVFRHHVELYSIINIYLITLLIYQIVVSLFLSFEFIVESLLVFLILIVISNYRYINTLRDIFVSQIPLVLLVSVIIGIYLGVDQPLRYSLLTIIDMISSSAILLTKASTQRYIYSLLLAVLYYNSPVVSIQLTTLLVFLLVHVVRNTISFNNRFRSKKVMGLMLSIDILIKPFAVRFL